MSHSINVQINRREVYKIHAGMDIWDTVFEHFSSCYSNRKIFVIIDVNVRQLHGARIEKECLRYFKACQIIEIPEGEKSKSVEQWQRLQDKLLQNNIERSTPVLAVGGGVTGDLGGFAAASVLRGVPLVHMPTSLLAMVDSSIGGKTGINHPKGKNLIGAFYQPDAVFSDLDFLRTLDRHEWIGGMAEMLKYAAIKEPVMFDELEQAVQDGFKPSERWLNLIQKSAAIKADIVQEDELEAGKRVFLNLGHTFGHALEKLSGYGNISHGEAVFVGMLAATHYSTLVGADIDKARFYPFKPLYRVRISDKIRIPDLIDAMRYDKKVKDETIRLVLLNRWGDPCVKRCDKDNESLLTEAWQSAFDEIN